MAATTGPSEFKVGFCGRATNVELQPEEGLTELRARVATAFGLTAPFELLNQEGVRIRSDLDQSFTPRTGGVCPEVSVDASDDVLLDLERAHEETGAVRWLMLRKVLADFRRQFAELYAGLADCRHQAAVLDEKMLFEKTSRDAGIAATRADLCGLSQRFDEESNRIRNEGRVALETAVQDVRKHLDDSLGQSQARVDEDIASLKDALAREKEERCAIRAALLQDVEDVKCTITREAEERAASLTAIKDEIEVVRYLLRDEKQERSSTLYRLETQNAELGVRLTEEQSLRDQEIRSVQQSMKEVRDAHQNEASRGVQTHEVLTKQIQDAAAAAEARLNDHKTSLEARLADLAAVEGRMQVSLDNEGRTRVSHFSNVTKSLEELEACIKKHEAGLKDTELAIHKKIEDGARHVEAERRKLEEDLAKYRVGEYASLVERVHAEEQNRAAEVEKVTAHCRSLQETLEKTNQNFQETYIAIAAENSRRREDDMGVMKRVHEAYAEEQRKWVNDLIELQGKEMTGANQALIREARTRGEELAREAAERMSSNIMMEVQRIEATTAELIKAQEDNRRSDSAQQESHAHKTTNELKECLTSHSEFMEALASEQKLLIKRMNEGFASEDGKREDLTVRVHRLESDMKQVKGHLPILFVPSGYPQR